MWKKKSAILDAVHETANGLHRASVMDLLTMREFDRLCLPPIEHLEPEQIKQIRESSHVSQAVESCGFECKCINGSKVGNWTEATHRRRP